MINSNIIVILLKVSLWRNKRDVDLNSEPCMILKLTLSISFLFLGINIHSLRLFSDIFPLTLCFSLEFYLVLTFILAFCFSWPFCVLVVFVLTPVQLYFRCHLRFMTIILAFLFSWPFMAMVIHL